MQRLDSNVIQLEDARITPTQSGINSKMYKQVKMDVIYDTKLEFDILNSNYWIYRCSEEDIPIIEL